MTKEQKTIVATTITNFKALNTHVNRAIFEIRMAVMSFDVLDVEKKLTKEEKKSLNTALKVLNKLDLRSNFNSAMKQVDKNIDKAG